ncbi:hypothetical protein C8F04DRAFT_457136 [Mycena alexandri]|uniref:Uncharacterized protein n=1 Tax=Mycena alexandri TaxID=1745969 RepID=A0AAD6T1V8_9AGAR|nr:hypothetical protein C8F04DRAFT_457136 [Mycena alexandri]
MDTETYSVNEYIPAPGPGEPVFTSSGGMFAGSQHFTVAGGTFNNIMKNYYAAPNVAPHFRIIPMGDINLQKELMVNKELWLLGRRRERNCVRRVYSATIDGRKSNVTVAVYQGEGAEEDWQKDTEMYMSVRFGPPRSIPGPPITYHDGVSLWVLCMYINYSPCIQI